MRIDYTNLFSNCALYLPALNVPYATMAQSGSFSREQQVTPQDLNFLSPTNALFFYPWALYSAGQAAQRSDAPALDMVATRDRSHTTVIGDSGGYEILSGVMPFHGEDTARRMLRWLESNTDYSAVLDFPTGTIASGGMMQHVKRLEAEGHDLAAMSAGNGFSRDFNACLTQTLLNNDLFVREATPGATKFLNVIHGRNEEESSAWFKAVCHYPFQGWAFAGGHRENLSLMLRRLIQMRDMKLLEKAE